jgi:hypothetical protein
MNIKPMIYDNLTIQQRITASTEALMRNDIGELKRLVETCPKKTYTQPDQAFCDGLMASVLSLYGLDNSKKIDLLLTVKPLLQGLESAHSDSLNVTITHVRPDGTRWPPKDMAEAHKPSDEFVT